jgi:drug/metabolite transporter (DMT)-like permease
MKYIVVTICFIIAYCGFGTINFYQSKNIEPTIKNLVIFNLCIIPITFFINLLVTFTFNKGYKALGEMLPITIIYLSAGVFAYVIVNYIFFKEIPRINQIVAILLVLIALIICNLKIK